MIHNISLQACFHCDKGFGVLKRCPACIPYHAAKALPILKNRDVAVAQVSTLILLSFELPSDFLQTRLTHHSHLLTPSQQPSIKSHIQYDLVSPPPAMQHRLSVWQTPIEMSPWGMLAFLFAEFTRSEVPLILKTISKTRRRRSVVSQAIARTATYQVE